VLGSAVAAALPPPLAAVGQHTPPGPPSAGPPGAPATLEEAFAKYDGDRDGMLNQAEVAVMIDDLGYDVDANYVGGVMGLFGKFDRDQSGSVEIDEFAALWTHLGGPPLPSGAAIAPPPPGPPPAAPTAAPPGPLAGGESLQEVFARYDRNRDGMLDQAEVAAMIDELGYDVDANYVDGVMGLFGKFDRDQSGGVEVDEFAALWAHLGGPPLADASPPAPTPAPTRYQAHVSEAGGDASASAPAAAVAPTRAPRSGSPTPAEAERPQPSAVNSLAGLAAAATATQEELLLLTEPELQELAAEHRVGVLQRRQILSEAASLRRIEAGFSTVQALSGRLVARSVLHSKSVLHGAFVGTQGA
jgi:Ca2+-binding EF-hand superfamily protein